MTRRRRQELADDASREFPPVTIRCPECGAFLREIAHAAGDFTVVGCGPCGETFRLSKNLDDWLPRRARVKTALRDADSPVDGQPSKARIKHR